MEWETGPGFRRAALAVPASGKAGFTRLSPAETGIHFTNQLSEARSLANRNLLSGSGVACGDVDGDGWIDLYFCNLDGTNALFRNLGGWKFEDITASAGVGCPGQDSMGCALVDVDGDGDLDLLVNALGNGTRLFLNDGKAHFTEVTQQAGLASRTGSTSMALADIDGDGDLDLYVTNFRPTTLQDAPQTRFRVKLVDAKPVVALVNGQPATTPEYADRFGVSDSGNIIEFGQVDALYLNDGKGVFKQVSFTDGTFLDENGEPLKAPPRDWGLAAQFHDLNGDGAPDLYVCNDLFTPDRIWINDGKGCFHALSSFALRSTSTFSMGVDFADIDRDGNMDFFVVDMRMRDHALRITQTGEPKPIRWPIGFLANRVQRVQNTLQLNRGDSTFAEISFYAGLEASDWSWTPIFLDVDLDGYEDLLVSNGQARDFQNIDMERRRQLATAQGRIQTVEDFRNFNRQYPPLHTPNAAWRNRGDLTFEDTSQAWGFDWKGISQGMALADLDNDGDLDVVMNNLNAEAGVLRNDSPVPRLAVRLAGLAPNRHGVGAKIKVTGGPVPQSQEMIAGGRYLSSDAPMRVFATGSSTNLTIEVNWRRGKRSVVRDCRPNYIYEIDESAAVATTHSQLAIGKSKPFFEDVSHLISHTHHEEAFDDFQRQPLLPRRLSQGGPGVAWADLDDDGWDDLLIGSGKGGALAVFRNNGKGSFDPIRAPPIPSSLRCDETGVLGLRPDPNTALVLTGLSNYEGNASPVSAVRIYDMGKATIDESLPGQASSPGPLALADIDGDGDLDLFVGGSVIPGHYPVPASSTIFRNQNGRFVLDPEVSATFAGVGLVSGAVFTDINGDGTADLVLACQWGPLRLFLNEGGRFKEATRQFGLESFKGWWNGVTAGDLDGDGRLDLVASNWGLNSGYRPSPDHPVRVYYGDFGSDGGTDIIEALYDPQTQREVPARGYAVVAAALPWITERFPTFESYGRAGVSEIYGDKLQKSRHVEATTLASMVFFNRGDRFEAKPLPPEAQFAPAFAVAIADFDGDGDEDVFLSQNFYATHPEDSRLDAGRAIWLRGDGKGGLTTVPGQISGVMIYGDQRGAALSDYDGDGRVDLVVTQNGAPTKLYRNLGATPGLRVRLHGPRGNPAGIGATIRIDYGDHLGPAREIHAGSGYWSQDSAVSVFARAAKPARLWVRWPGGKTTSAEIPVGALEVSSDFDGMLKKLR